MSNKQSWRLKALCGTLAGVFVIAAAAGSSVASSASSVLHVDGDSLGGPCSDDRAYQQVSASAPWCTMARAIEIAPSGATVLLRSGSYPAMDVAGSRSRTSPLTLRAVPGATVSMGRVFLRDSTYLAFAGMTFTEGFFVFGESSDIWLSDSVVSPLGVNVGAGARRVTIARNSISSPEGTAINFSSTKTQPPISDVRIIANRITGVGVDAMQLKNFRDVLVEGNEISGIQRLNPNAHPDAIQTVYGGSGLTIRGNYFHDNDAQQIFTKDGQTSGVRIENNLIADNGQSDPTTSLSAVQLIESTSPVIVNNTIVNSGSIRVRGTTTTDAVIKNNVLSNFQILDDATVAYEDHNFVIGQGGTGPDDLTGDPLFINQADRDYHPRAGSPLIDAGTSDDAPTTDRTGKRRFDDPNSANRTSTHDIGAHEFGTQAHPATPVEADPAISALRPNPSKFQVRRAKVIDGRLDVLVDTTRRANGNQVTVSFRAKGYRWSFDETVVDGRIRFKRVLPAAQRRASSGIVNIAYRGNTVVRPDFVRVRAAQQKARLARSLLSLKDGKLLVYGSVNPQARGVVRLRLTYDRPNGSVGEWKAKVRIQRDGRWGLAAQLPAEAARGGYLTLEFTGYYKKRIRGERIAKRLDAGDTFITRGSAL